MALSSRSPRRPGCRSRGRGGAAPSPPLSLAGAACRRRQVQDWWKEERLSGGRKTARAPFPVGELQLPPRFEVAAAFGALTISAVWSALILPLACGWIIPPRPCRAKLWGWVGLWGGGGRRDRQSLWFLLQPGIRKTPSCTLEVVPRVAPLDQQHGAPFKRPSLGWETPHHGDQRRKWRRARTVQFCFEVE